MLGTLEYLLLNGWRDFQVLRHQALRLPPGFQDCMHIAEGKGWMSPSLPEPLSVIVIHPCRDTLVTTSPAP